SANSRTTINQPCQQSPPISPINSRSNLSTESANSATTITQRPGPSGTQLPRIASRSISTSRSTTTRRQNFQEPKTIDICEDAIDRKERQIHITTVFSNPAKPKVTRENSMTIIKAQISQTNNEDEIRNLLIEFCEP